ncbi:MAG TPA: LytR C-terminal domain-containing protein [Telluria sp.]|nr:LytR C-terminal domain-containing protein [Telluria sp.]
MKPVLTCIAAACTGILLLACAVPLQRAPDVAAPQVAGSPEARNRAATARAEAGDYPGAIVIWRALAAQVRGPESAYLLRNLGYAQYLHQEFDAALMTLGRACLLDPLNPRGWRQLGAVFDKLGQLDRAQLMFRQAAALEEHDLKADYAMAAAPASPAVAEAAAAPVQHGEEWPGAVTLDPSSGVVALPAMESGARSDAHAVLLEISNGNGIRGMAAATARGLDAGQLRVVRLSNQKGFDVRQTRLEYEPAQRARAEQVARQLGAAALVEVESCRAAEMRLVLGKDRMAVQETARTRRVARQRAG